MATREAGLALRRFGLGARIGDMGQVGGDARGYVLAQLDRRNDAIVTADLAPSDQTLADVQRQRRLQKEAREQAKQGVTAQPVGGASSQTMSDDAGSMMQSPTPANGAQPKLSPQAMSDARPKAVMEPLTKPGRVLRDAFLADVEARIAHSVATGSPFLERLVLFWSSHFAVSATKGPVRGIAGAFEREAIRPHILGKFSDMLKAVTQHPAMLIYLDNAQSIGPNSRAGQRRTRGLNENLARELLELHTLGVDGGYTQTDVTNLAKLLTGWSVGNANQPNTPAGRFFFAAPRHEPGGATVLGRGYAQGGLAEGEAAIADLVRHPATARHIARKFARHFVSDNPPPALVGRLEKSFRDTQGDLRALAAVLANSAEAWDAPQTKIIPPYDYMVSLVRGFSPLKPPMLLHRFAAALGQPTFMPPSPKGWPDEDDAWTGPAAIRERLRIVELAAKRAGTVVDARELGPALLGGLLNPATAQTVARAETREQGIELLLMSPEFLRR